MQYSVAQQSNQGGRDYNEDRTAVFVRDDALLLIIADGLGGHAGGELASQAVIDALGASFNNASDDQLANADRFLTLSINYAHHMIHRRALTQGYDVGSPKSTCAACLIYRGVAQWAHAGDSRLYLISKTIILEQTRDHVSARVAAADSGPINRCVGGVESPKPEISSPHEVSVGDIFVLASDGAWACFEASDLQEYIDPEHPTLGLDGLLQLLELRNKVPSDNLSMVILFWGVQQRDNPPVDKMAKSDKIELLGRPGFDPDRADKPEKFDMEEFDNAIYELENFITDIDDQL